MGRHDKLKQKLSRYKRRLHRLKHRLDQDQGKILKSNTKDVVNKIDSSEMFFKIGGSSLQIFAKDPTGTTTLFGYVPLNSINTIPINPSISNNFVNNTYTQPPYKVIYIDQPSSWWPESAIAQSFYDIVDAGFNIINLAFMVNGTPCDMALVWSRELADINPDTQKTYREEILEYAHARGCSILLSTGGATEGNFASVNPQDYANNVSNFVLNNSLDGVDFDLENFAPGLIAPGLSSEETIDWLINVSRSTRSMLGPFALISHAPQAPYFGAIGNSSCWTGANGGYTAVYANQIDANINFFNVQYYNQGDSNYTTFDTIFIDSGSNFP